MSAADPTQTPGSARRPERQHRRVDTEAGAPSGETAEAILDLPASGVDPADVGPLTGTFPGVLPGVAELPLLKDGRVVSRPGQAPAALARVFESDAPTGYTVASDGVPVGPDGQPLTRRQLREMRRRQESGAGPESSPSTARRAEAPAGAPAGLAGEGEEPVTRESLALEAAALAERLAAAGDDPANVDPQLLRQQEALAEKARLLNQTGTLAIVPPAAPVESAGAEPAAESVRHEPIQAQSAHGLDSLPASEWGSRERTLVIVAAVVFAILVIALIIALAL
ncbi:hypothetical protein [Citricoccus sp.]|uniref:hypothetical protein n=1 Tax=Citricoccus sp. TaxID=1978372 RepID=UPI002CD35BE7|nr:hypothetical protein [Citricoccus sp.]HRO95347.1 hypothetical protein [Citricoccus sp.]